MANGKNPLKKQKICNAEYYDMQSVLDELYVQHRIPMDKKRKINKYTAEGRREIHKSLGNVNMDTLYHHDKRMNEFFVSCNSISVLFLSFFSNQKLKIVLNGHETTKMVLFFFMRLTWLYHLMNRPSGSASVEYNDNRIAMYVAQSGKSAVTGKILEANDVHCHHKKPVLMGCDDSYQNLIIISGAAHRLIHSANEKTIQKYLLMIKPDKKQLAKINALQQLANMQDACF